MKTGIFAKLAAFLAAKGISTGAFVGMVTAGVVTVASVTTTCVVLSNSQSNDIPAGHTHIEVIDSAVAATCSDTGLTEGRHCSDCGYILIKQNATPKLEHTYTGDMDATCNLCGETRKIACDHAETETISAKAASCSETGLTEGKKCKNCEAVIVKQDTIPLVAHTYDDKYDEACNICGHIRDAECAHTETETVSGKAATCSQSGLTDGKKCKKCGEIIEEQRIIPIVAHTEVIDMAKAPTCVASGISEGKHCSVCQKVIVVQQDIAPLGHVEMTNAAKAPTCSNTGLTKGIYCAVCNLTLVAQEEIAALPHTEVIDAAVAPTCIATGLTEGRHCSVCNKTLVSQTSIPTTAHTEIIDASKAPTCGATGLTEGKHCSVCYKVLVEQQDIEATGNHAYGSGKQCTVCGNAKPSEGLEFTSNGDGTCSVTGIGTCADTDLVIPKFSPNGDIVTSIGENAFAIGYQKGILTSVIIPDSVISIEESAFKWNPKLTNVSIPKSVTSIGDYAFYGAESLTSITIPEGVTRLGSSALGSCKKLTNIVLPESLTVIADRAFAGCQKLPNLTIPNSVTSIGEYAFAMCYALESISLPDSLTVISMALFNVCDGMTTVTIPAGVTIIDTWAFKECTKLTKIVFKGTETQWNAITKEYDWDIGSGNYYIEFSNGDTSELKEPIPPGTCFHCKGSGKMLCPKCNGTLISVEEDSNGDRYYAKCGSCTKANTVYICMYCNGSGSASGSSSGGSSSGGSSSCYYCYGTGRIECIGCDGTGQVLKYYANHIPVYGPCIACSGSGKGTCPCCGGDGDA